MLKNVITLTTASIVAITVGSGINGVTSDLVIAQPIHCNPSGNTPEMTLCAKNDYQASDKQLNRVYQRLLAHINPTEKQRLIEVQRVWINFRDQTCHFESALNVGGTMESIVILNCLNRMTQERTQYLENYWLDTRNQPLPN